MAVRTFSQFKDGLCRSFMSMDNLDPDDPIKYAEYRSYMEDPNSQETFMELYKESLEAEKAEAKRNEEERRDKEEWIRAFSNEIHLKRLKLIYNSMLNIFKGWEDRIEETQPYDPPRAVNTANAFCEDFIVVCMKIAAADKEIEESETAWLNDITGLHKTPAEYYSIFRDSRATWNDGKIIILRSLIIATLIDIHEGKRGSDVNADNVKRLFMQAAKTIAAMDGEVENGETYTCAQLSRTLDELHEKYKKKIDSRNNLRYKVPDGYTGSIRIE